MVIELKMYRLVVAVSQGETLGRYWLYMYESCVNV